MVQYWYDAWGNHKVVDSNGNAITNANHIGNLNPFRYRGYYFDRETGLYFLQTRYYDPEIGRFLNRDSVAYADPQTINGLNLYAYCLNNPVAYVDPTGSTALGFLALLAISSFASWIITNVFGEDIAGGVSSVINGGTAIYTGSSLLSFGPIGWLAGGTLILIGVGTMLFGANEIALGVTGTNYLQSWTGMSDATYNGLYVGLNIASVIGTIAGGVYMNYANVNIYGNHIKTTKGAKSFQRYSLIDANGLKQYRFFNSRGNAWYDKDFRHAGNFRFPHYHGWDNGTRIGGHWTIMDLINWLF